MLDVYNSNELNSDIANVQNTEEYNKHNVKKAGTVTLSSIQSN